MPENIEVTQRWWSAGQVADALNVTQQSVSRWIRDGLLGAHRFGGLWRISDSDLTEFLRRTRHAANVVRSGGEPGAFAEALQQASEAVEVAEEVEQ